MIPRLPPFLIAVIGGASIYGIKAILDRIEPKAIGPPGSTQHSENMYKIKTFARRGGVAMAAAGTLYAAYWVYDKRTNRVIPAASRSNDDKEAFYSDQYSDRERRFRQETAKLKQEQLEREERARSRLAAEQASMELERTHRENVTKS